MNARVRKSAVDRKAEIVRAAIRLAAEIGPDRVTTQHLADAVGLTQPAIFRHFATKADIWTEVGQAIIGMLGPERDGDPARRAVDQLRALVVRQFGFVATTPAILFSRVLHAENDRLRQHFESVMSDRRRGFSGLVLREIDAGYFRADLVANDGAAIILAIILGLAMRRSLERYCFNLRAEGTRLIFAVVDGWLV